MKKYIIIIFIGMIGCSFKPPEHYKPVMPLTQQEAMELKSLFYQQVEQYGLYTIGINTSYWYGYIITSLYHYVILTSEDGQKFCDVIYKLEDLDGYRSCPIEMGESCENNRYMSIDDYSGTIMGLYFVSKVNQCGKEILSDMLERYPKGLLKMGCPEESPCLWTPVHANLLYRANSIEQDGMGLWDSIDRTIGFNTIAFADKDMYISSKIMWMTRVIMARYEFPTEASRSIDTLMHNNVDFNYVLDKYFDGNENVFWLTIKQFLKGLL
jgi:hypothetical protein